MGKITAIKDIRKQGKRVGIYVDGKFILSVNLETALQKKLKVDTELSSELIKELAEKDEIYRCREAAVRFLNYRPRSESELRKRLERRGFKGGVIDIVTGRLKEQGLIDDVSFAEFWTDNRESFSPRSRYLTRLELRKKGVSEDAIDRAVSSIDDSGSAYRVALSRTRRMSAADYTEFRRRLADYLRRRGFDYDVINRVVEKIWKEKGEIEASSS